MAVWRDERSTEPARNDLCWWGARWRDEEMGKAVREKRGRGGGRSRRSRKEHAV